MEEKDRLDMIEKLEKHNLQTSQNVINMLANNNLQARNDKKEIEKKIESLEHKLDMLIADINNIPRKYNDEELVMMKQSMTWEALSRKVEIPVSTLRNRVRKFMMEVNN